MNNDYIKQLESENEELRNRLAKQESTYDEAYLIVDNFVMVTRASMSYIEDLTIDLTANSVNTKSKRQHLSNEIDGAITITREHSLKVLAILNNWNLDKRK